MTSFGMSHFSYCPLVWMFHDRKLYNKINKIHERAVRIIHKDSTSNFERPRTKSNSVSVHQMSLQLLLLIEIHRTINNLNPSFIAQVFVTNAEPYNLRDSTNLVSPQLGQTCMALILLGLLPKIYGRLCRKKSKSLKHWRF